MSDHHNDLYELLRDPDKKIGETQGLGGVLARLWRTILFDLNMQNSRLEWFLGTFIERTRRSSVDRSLAGYHNKGNLRRELAKDTMTFKVLVKALRVIDITHIRIGFELTHRTGAKTLHGVDLNVSDELFAGDDLSEDKE